VNETLPHGPFGVIYADPPWSFGTWSDKGRNRCPDAMVRQKGLAERHYKTMSMADIAALPVASVAAKNAALFLWCVDCQLPDAIDIARGWGFKFKTVAFTWVKTDRTGETYPMGLGYWTRGNPEQCLLFTRGKQSRKSAAVRQLVVDPRQEHRRKPEEVEVRSETLLDGPYLEMFARTKAPGWTSWGNDVERFRHEPQDNRLASLPEAIAGNS